MIPPLLELRAALLFACALVLGLVSVGPAAYAQPAAQDAPTDTPQPTLTPTPSPPDAELAARFARQGRLEQAAGAYLALVDQGEPDERLAARFALALLYLDAGEVASAVRQLDAYLLEAPSGRDVRPAQFLLADALARDGGWQEALPLYDAYISAGGGATTYARLGRAEALARLGREAEATAEAEQALSEELPSATRLPFILTMAQALEEPRPAAALVWYERLGRESEAPSDRALALWRTAVIKGDLRSQLDAWLTIVRQYPETATAQEIVDEPPGAGTTIVVQLDSYYPGLVYFRAGRTREAQKAFEASLEANEAGPDRSLAARSSYYLAVLAERAGAVERAVASYARVGELDPRVELADDALWWQGRLQEQLGRGAEAAASYQRLLSTYRGSDWAPEARFRLALIAYDRGRAEEASEQLAAIASGSDGEARQRALLWRGKALAAADADAAARAVWRSLREEAPADYYGLRAAVLLGETEGGPTDADLDGTDEHDWRALERWLLDVTGIDPASGLEALLYDRHWGLGQELLALGMERRADAEFGSLLESAQGDPAVLYQLLRSFQASGLSHLSSRAATRLLAATPEGSADRAPRDLWRLAYPASFGEVVLEAARDADAPDLLLLALVRQESFFDPLAGSSAGALGLTQVIPATGEEIAQDLELTDFEVEDLYRPQVSLRFGAHYLGEQLETFDGNVYHALAAYNGGPGSALRWRDVSGGDVDRFVEEIDFAQTEAYVKLVAENLARYRQLYQDLDRPVLPED